jgi:hypothetical protein
MKKLCLFLLLSATYTLLHAQIVTGKVVDKLSGEAIPYVNIGVAGKGIGTVSDINGNFAISLPDSVNSALFRCSCIGYKPYSLKCKDVRQLYEGKTALIQMDQNVVSLSPVVVRPKIYRKKILGNENHGSSVIAGFMSNDLGSELGTIMHIKRSPTFIEDVNFNIASNKMDSIKFRVNIYSMKNGQPDSIILKSPIYISTYSKRPGRLSVDLRKYDLWVDGDFFVALEWIENYGERNIFFSAGLMNSNSMYRKTSQDVWKKANPVGIGFNSTVTFEK